MASKSTRELTELFTNALKHGLEDDEIRKTVKVDKTVKPKHCRAPVGYFKYVVLVAVIGVLLVLQVPKEAKGEYVKYYKSKLQSYFTLEAECLIYSNDLASEIVRKPTNCMMCHNLSEVFDHYNMFQHSIKHNINHNKQINSK